MIVLIKEKIRNCASVFMRCMYHSTKIATRSNHFVTVLLNDMESRTMHQPLIHHIVSALPGRTPVLARKMRMIERGTLPFRVCRVHTKII